MLDLNLLSEVSKAVISKIILKKNNDLRHEMNKN